MKWRRILLLAILAAPWWISCGGGGGSPSTPAARMLIVTAVQSSNFSPNLHEATLALDGSVISTFESNTGVPIASLSSSQDARSGRHTLVVTIRRQVRSPHTYVVSSQIIITEGFSNRREINLGPRTVSLSTGGTVSLSFDV